MGVGVSEYPPLERSAQCEPHARRVARRDVLLGPRPVKVTHRGARAQRAQQQRGGRVQREVDVHDLGVACRAAGGAPEAEQPAWQRPVGAVHHLDRTGRIGGGAQHHAARLRELLEEGTVVTVESPHCRRKPAEAEHRHTRAAPCFVGRLGGLL